MTQEVQSHDYNISVDSPSEIDRNISIHIPRGVYNARFEKALRQVLQQAHIKGFRPGRAPKAVVSKMYGERIHSDVLGELVSAAYQEAVQSHSLKVVGYPEININGERADEKDFEVTAAVSVIPEPTITGFEGIEYSAETTEFDETMVTQRLDGMRDTFAEVKEVEGRKAAKTGDLVKIDFHGNVDGKEFPGSHAHGRFVELGSNQYPAGFEDGIAGMEVGSEKDISVELTDEQGEEFAGKTATYHVSLGGIFTKELPELNDELAKKSGVAETLDELKQKIRVHMKRDTEQKNRTLHEDAYFKALIAKNEFKVPQSLIDEEIRNYLFQMGLLDPSRDESYRYDVSAFREHLGEQAEFRVKRVIALTRIIEQEKHHATEADLENWLDEQARQKEASRDEINQIYNYPKDISRLKDLVSRHTMIDKLLSNATASVQKASTESSSKTPKRKKKAE